MDDVPLAFKLLVAAIAILFALLVLLVVKG